MYSYLELKFQYETFSLYRNQENEGQSWYLRTLFLEILIITGLTSDAILYLVARNVATSQPGTQ